MTKPKFVTREIPGGDWRSVILEDYEDDFEWEKVDEDFSGTWRWGNWREVIVKHKPTGTFWSGGYATGQESQGIDDVNDFSGPVDLTQVSQEAVMVWKWEPVHAQGTDGSAVADPVGDQ